MAERFITIATFHDLTEAHIIKGRLEAEGILCFLADENIVAVQPFYSIAVGGVKLQVTEGDEEEARTILSNLHKGDNEYILDDSIELASPEQALPDRLTCPACGSEQIEEDKRVPSILSFRFLFGGRKYSCKNCGNTWKE